MSRFLNVLRSWLVMVSIIAMGNTVQSFRDHSFLSEKLYTGNPSLVNGLQARTFGIWTLLSSVIRCYCAIDIRNKTYCYMIAHQIGCMRDKMAKLAEQDATQIPTIREMQCNTCANHRVNPKVTPVLLGLTHIGMAPIVNKTLAEAHMLFLYEKGKLLYNITLLTFFLALGHFLSEVFVYGTAAATIGVLAPLMVASFSILGMLIGLQYLEVEVASQNKKRN